MNAPASPLVRTLSDYFRQRYGKRVHKIALDGGFTCPNRDGSKGAGGCAFCDAQGSRAPYCRPGAGIADQMRAGIDQLGRRTKAGLFIAYFQAFSGTYAPPEILRARYDAALCDPRVIGLSIATRSDCLNDAALDVVASYLDRLTEVRLEFGLQTTTPAVLEAMNCHHTPLDFVGAVQRTRRRGVKTVAHVIFGLPGDTPEGVFECARLINEEGVEGVKIHNLYLTTDSALGRAWLKRPHDLMSRDEYIGCVAEFVARLHPSVVIERVAGDAPRQWLLAPHWTIDKQRQWQIIEEELSRRGLRQGAKAWLPHATPAGETPSRPSRKAAP